MCNGNRFIVPALASIIFFSANAPAKAQTTTQPRFDKARIRLAWQIALEQANFSPGILDAQWGRKSDLALDEYAARFFPGVDKFDRQVYEALKVDVANAVTTYTITADDQAQVGDLPDDWNEKAKLDRLNYDSLLDCISEKFQCTRALLQSLNPGVNLNKIAVGTQLQVPNTPPFAGSAAGADAASQTSPKAAYLTVDLKEKLIRAYDADNKQMLLLHCSVAKDKAKLPDHDAVVKVLVADPNYTFNPEHWPEVHNVDHVLTIPPGPRNPVGVIWIGLDLPGYGMHGNPKPELIGKTGSHGCFRLTNWDAVRLYPFVKIGTPVKMMNPDTAN
jgi:lipoprotein-anchoring transpeptidase ErfK/SrfK